MYQNKLRDLSQTGHPRFEFALPTYQREPKSAVGTGNFPLTHSKILFVTKTVKCDSLSKNLTGRIHARHAAVFVENLNENGVAKTSTVV